VTDHIALELDLAQYSGDEGPCIRALAGNTIRVGYLPDDERFPHFAAGAADQRVLSVLSTPIRHDGAIIGTLNVYSRQSNAFDANDENIANVISAEAANAIAKSELLVTARTVREQLQAEYDEATLISRAEGMLMVLQDCSVEQATHLIQNAAQANAEAMIVTAERILTAVTDEHNADAQ
jgi:GAF domain-containing protein